jgi:hypothetical protein
MRIINFEKYKDINMKTYFQISVVLFLSIALSSCYVVLPKYTSVDKVLTLKNGMTLNSVNETLSLQPYDLHQKDTNGFYTYIYKYRLNDVKRIPILMKKNKGVATEGGFKNLLVTYSPNDEVVLINTTYETLETDANQKKINLTAVITSISTLITVTVPSVLLFISKGS